MKRKIFHTPHGRIMMKIISSTKNNYRTLLILYFNRHLLSKSKLSCKQIMTLEAKNRNKQYKLIKQFKKISAEKIAERLYKQLPEEFKEECMNKS